MNGRAEDEEDWRIHTVLCSNQREALKCQAVGRRTEKAAALLPGHSNCFE